ncbi:MAG: tetratricopeptide repeat protein [Proteobacteria bacterium]|nr:tetratricopeptide repeat protein [Pseudomonadota bacterium]
MALLVLAACGGDRPEDAVREADHLFGQGHWEEAAAAYASLPPEVGRWRAYGAWRAAVVYRDGLQDLPRAREAFEACAKTWADDEWGYTCQVDLADLLRDSGEPRDAIGAYRTAVEMRPNGAHLQQCLLSSGRAYLTLGQPEQARVEWEELLQRFPTSAHAPIVALEMARSFDLQGDHKGALAAYQDVQDRFSTHSVAPLAAFGEGEALEQLGRLEEAEAKFVAAMEVHPNPGAVQIKLDSVRERRQRREQDESSVMDHGVKLNR